MATTGGHGGGGGLLQQAAPHAAADVSAAPPVFSNPAVTGLAALPLTPLAAAINGGQQPPRPSSSYLQHPTYAQSLRQTPILPTPTGTSSFGSATPMPTLEERNRYHLYERESTWAEVEKLSGYISRCAMTHPASSPAMDMSRERYHDLYNVALHLLRAIEALDPDLSKPFSRYQSSQQDSSVPYPVQTTSARTPQKHEYGASYQMPSQGSPSTTYSRGMYLPDAMAPRPPPVGPSLRQQQSQSQSMAYPPPIADARHPIGIVPRLSEPIVDAVKGPGPIGIARYNQSILSGMLAMRGPGMSGQRQQLMIKPSAAGYPDLASIKGEAGTGTTTTSSGSTTGTTKKKRRRKTQRKDLHCHVCGVTDTPEWRRGPDGDHTLCNACGLHYAKALKKEKEAREKEGRKHSIDMLLNSRQGRETAAADAAATNVGKTVKSDNTTSLADSLDG